jgi:hypothetical protein
VLGFARIVCFGHNYSLEVVKHAAARVKDAAARVKDAAARVKDAAARVKHAAARVKDAAARVALSLFLALSHHARDLLWLLSPGDLPWLLSPRGRPLTGLTINHAATLKAPSFFRTL